MATFCAAVSCSTVISDSPMWRILPSFCSAASSPTWSSAGNFGVDAVQLEEVDAVGAEPAQAHLDLLTQIRREAERCPLVLTGSQEPGLGGDDEAVPIRVQCFADQFLGHVGPVGVRGVEEVDAEFDGAAQDANGFGAVVGRAPDAVARQTHGPESEPVDGEVAADGERSRCLSDRLGGHVSTVRRRGRNWHGGHGEIERPRRPSVHLPRDRCDGRGAAAGLPPSACLGGHRPRADSVRGGGRRGDAVGHAPRRRVARRRDDGGGGRRVGGHRRTRSAAGAVPGGLRRRRTQPPRLRLRNPAGARRDG